MSKITHRLATRDSVYSVFEGRVMIVWDSCRQEMARFELSHARREGFAATYFPGLYGKLSRTRRVGDSDDWRIAVVLQIMNLNPALVTGWSQPALESCTRVELEDDWTPIF